MKFEGYMLSKKDNVSLTNISIYGSIIYNTRSAQLLFLNLFLNPEMIFILYLNYLIQRRKNQLFDEEKLLKGLKGRKCKVLILYPIA